MAWDESDLILLIEEVRLWKRVRSERALDPQDLLARVVGGLWGARVDGAGARLEVSPSMPPGWKAMAIRGLRAHRTLLDLEARSRAEWLTVRIAVIFGPPIAVLVRLPEPLVASRVTVDETPLESAHAVFIARDEHEVTLYRTLGDS